MSGTDATPALPIPMQDNPVGDTGRFSRPWTRYIDNLNSTVAANTAALAAKKGITDGQPATPGQLGEYMTASGSVSLSSGSVANVASLTLPPGDWWVQGNVQFTPAGGTHPLYFVCSVSTVSATIGRLQTYIAATFPNGAPQVLGSGGAFEVNVVAATAVYVVANAGFSGGTMDASGIIDAWRVR